MSFFSTSEIEDAGYQVRDLFPGFTQKQDQMEQRRYVETVLVRLAKEKDLSITELMNQELQAVADMAGQVILGHIQDPDTGGMREGAPVPMEVREYRVMVRSIEYEQSFQEPQKKPTFKMTKRSIRWQDGVRWAGYRVRGRARLPHSEDNIIDTRLEEKELMLQDAWRCLRQGGRYCRRVSGQRLQRRMWYYEEVLPSMETPKDKAVGAGKR
jgi:hypothetical protein